MAPASPDGPQLLVPKPEAGPPDASSLDPRGVFVLALPQHTFVWQARAPPQFHPLLPFASNAPYGLLVCGYLCTSL